MQRPKAQPRVASRKPSVTTAAAPLKPPVPAAAPSITVDSTAADDVVESSDDDDSNQSDDADDPVVQTLPLFYTSNPDYSLPSSAHFQPTFDDDVSMDLGTSGAGEGAAAAGDRKSLGYGPLALLQYPHRSNDVTTPHPLLPPSLRPDIHPEEALSSTIRAKYKPGVRQLLLEVPLEVKVGIAESRFSEDRARNFARGLPQASTTVGKGKQSMLEPQELDPMSFIHLNSIPVPEQTHYVVAMTTREGIHLVPLAQTLQLRPQLDYLDRLVELASMEDKAARKRAAANGDSSDEDRDDDVDVAKEEASPKRKSTVKKSLLGEAKSIQVSMTSAADASARLGGVTSAGSGGRVAPSLFAPLRAAEAESWLPLTHFHSATNESQAIRNKILCPDTQTKLQCCSTWSDVLSPTS